MHGISADVFRAARTYGARRVDDASDGTEITFTFNTGSDAACFAAEHDDLSPDVIITAGHSFVVLAVSA